MVGAGTEKFLINVIKNADYGKYEINLIQTDYIDRKRLSEDYVAREIHNATVYTIKSHIPILRSLIARQSSFEIVNQALSTFLYTVQRFFLPEEVKQVLDNSDLIYLVLNKQVALISRNSKSVIVGSSHTDGPFLKGKKLRHELVKKYLSFVYSRINYFHYLTDELKRESFMNYKTSFVLPNGVDTEFFHPPIGAKSYSGVLKFLFVGRLEESKGVDILLRAWDRLNHSHCELHVVGKGTLEGLVSSWPEVIYHKNVEDRELAQLYANSDVFVFPTLGERYPLVILEALASGLAVVTTNILHARLSEFDEFKRIKYVDTDLDSLCNSMKAEMDEPENVWNQESILETRKRLTKRYDWKVVTTTFYEKLHAYLYQSDKAWF